MFARATRVQGDPSRMDELVQFVRRTVKPATDRLTGNLGLGMAVDRTAGVALVTTIWSDSATIRASEPVAARLQEAGARKFAGDVQVERGEVLHVDVRGDHHVGDVLRIVRMTCPPGGVAPQVAWLRHNVAPALRRVPGYVSYVIAGDPATGRLVTLATYGDPVAAAVAFSATTPQRTAAAERGLTVETVETYDVAIVAIRAAQRALPRQRTIHLPTEAPL